MKLTDYQKAVVDDELKKELTKFREQFPHAGKRLFPCTENATDTIDLTEINPSSEGFRVTGKVTAYFTDTELFDDFIANNNIETKIAAVTGMTNDQIKKDLADLRKQFRYVGNSVSPSLGGVPPKFKPCPTKVMIHIDNPEFNSGGTFGDAVKNAMAGEKSLADKAFDKFKKDERKHTAKLRRVLGRVNDLGNLVTAYDAKASMVIMWELLREGYIEDVTPAARTGGAVTPDTTYCYKITSDGKFFAKLSQW